MEPRFEEGFTLDDFKHAILNQSEAWLGTDMERFLRPETLFKADKFDGYVNARSTSTSVNNKNLPDIPIFKLTD